MAQRGMRAVQEERFRVPLALAFGAGTRNQGGRLEGMTVVSKMIVRYNPDEEDFFVCAFAANVHAMAGTSA